MALYPRAVFKFLFNASVPVIPLPNVKTVVQVPSTSELGTVSSSGPQVLRVHAPYSKIVSCEMAMKPAITLVILVSVPGLHGMLVVQSLLTFYSSVSVIKSSFSGYFVESVIKGQWFSGSFIKLWNSVSNP